VFLNRALEWARAELRVAAFFCHQNGVNSAKRDTLARLQFLPGRTAGAMAAQEKAATVKQERAKRDDFVKTLASYREGKSPPSETTP
jgi:hypothetical protein